MENEQGQKPEETKNFIQGFVELCQETEIPEIFALWCAIAGISCGLGRRVWLDMGTYKIYPNFYIILVASSGRYRKSTVINQVKRIVKQLTPPPNLISQKITPEAMIEALRSVSLDPQKLGAEEATGFVLVDELSTFLNKNSYEAGLAPLLIQFYDGEDFEYRTKMRGVEKATNTCLGLLGGSTVDWIRSAIPLDAVGGGLTSRIIFVYVDTPVPPVAITTFGDRKKKLLESLIKQLNLISVVSGEMKMTENALFFFKYEYERFYKESPFYEEKGLSGYAGRRHVHMLKTAMALSVAERKDLIITEQHLQGAKAILEQSELTMKLVLNLICASEMGSVITTVLNLIRARGEITRSDLLQKVAHQIGARELTDVLDTLVAMKKVEAEAQPQRKQIVYRYLKN